MNSEQKQQILTEILSAQIQQFKLSAFPTNEELLPYVRLNLKRRRLKKKFLKEPMFYRKRLPNKIVKEFTMKKLSQALAECVNDIF
jgi:hypothetical protein